MKKPIVLVLAQLALLTAPAAAQWTPMGGGSHTGWDYTPPPGATIGGDHNTIDIFTIQEGAALDIGAAAFLDAAQFVIDGDLNAVNADVVLGSDSAGISIMAPAPSAGRTLTLLQPLHLGFAPLIPMFDWNDLTPPGSLYDLDVSNDATAAPPNVAGPGGAVNPPFDISLVGLPTLPTNFPALAPLTDGATYSWRVRENGGGVWSEVWTFTVDGAPPTPPALILPAEGNTVSTTPLFDWTDVFDLSGVTYTLVVDDDCAFGSPEITQVGLFTSDFLAVAPLAPGTYCWRVTAIDGAGNMTGSIVGTFIVGATTTTTTTVDGDGSWGHNGGGGGGCSIFGFAAPAGNPLALIALIALAAVFRRR